MNASVQNKDTILDGRELTQGNANLPAGVVITDLTPHADTRGVFTELHRANWDVDCTPIQWNAVHSKPNVLRGVHVHAMHIDYLIAISGILILGLHDLRRSSSTSELSCLIELRGEEPRAITIPPGVCHGFYYPVASTHIYAMSDYWDSSEEIGCMYDSPELGLDWPASSPILSDRDAAAGTYAQMREAFRSRWEFLYPGKPW